MPARVSVVIPAYNKASTIAPAIESVLRQTVQAVEVIVVDDGSSDETRQRVRRFGDRVRYLRQERSGVSAARNLGIREARGEWVAFLDGDDLWLPRKLERQLEVLSREPSLDAVQCSVHLVNDRLEVVDSRPCASAQDTMLDFLLFRNLPGFGSTLLARKRCLEAMGGFGTDLVILEDWDLACRLARTGSLRSVPEFLVLYRQHPGNRSRVVEIHEEPGFRSLGRLFADPALPAAIRAQEARIWACFYGMLAGGYIQHRQWRRGLSWTWKALRTSPTVCPYFAGMPLRRLRRVFTARQRLSLAGQLMQHAKPCPLCGDGVRVTRPRSAPGASELLRCRGCGLAYWAGSWDADQVKEHYHGYYGDGSIGYDPLTGRRYHALLERVERLRPPGRVLDVGCGAGHFLAVAETRGWEAVGLEVSRSALDALRQVQRERHLAFSIVEGPLAQAGFPERHFDAVTLFEVLEHLDDPMDTLAEVHRLLKDGGLLYLTTPNFDSLSRRLLGRRWRVIAQEHRCLFTTRAIITGLNRLGFRAVSVGTKNIDIPEVLSKWGVRKQHAHPTDRSSSSQRLRRTIEEVEWLRAVKAGVNHALRLLRLGDTLDVLAVKGDVASPESVRGPQPALCESVR